MKISSMALAATLLAALPAVAAPASGTITADNYYQLYVGNADGSFLSFVGRNEVGGAGSPGTYNWSLAETWNFNVGPGQYLYLVSWDDDSTAEGWIGQFTLPTGTLYSTIQDWVYVDGVGSPSTLGTSISDASIAGQILAAESGSLWQALNVSDDNGPNGTAPWGTIAGIGASAHFLANGGDDGYRIFRTADPVPEASTWAAGAGLAALAGVGYLRRRKRQS